MTKARGAVDSIGKAQAEGPLSFYQRFLRITFCTFRCSYVRTPKRALVGRNREREKERERERKREGGGTHAHHTRAGARAHTHPRARSLFFPSSPSRLRLPPVLSFFALRAILLPLDVVLPPSFSFLVSLLYIFTVYVCARARTPRFNRCTRFHARHDTTAARGRLCTWVNGKMSFETFLGRSRSPHCQSYTRAIPFHASRSRENAARVSPGFSPRKNIRLLPFFSPLSFFLFLFSSFFLFSFLFLLRNFGVTNTREECHFGDRVKRAPAIPDRRAVCALVDAREC